ncbi:glycosyl transferase family 2 [Priestia aryabhattai]|uniref:glycosyltransferase family 2 protein n=1 Tax=Bacillaceae TaxID=186817 RepID=UPI000BA03880|nr:glycosyltransferase [Bacillus sp. CBEL-1]OZT13807.1 glycosyl transferase family 2 [Priestia aryabhattai]TDB49860.1 glycosyltransferase [Bacillus sp. CBEL-1]USY53521.1 glycosyltransferase [Bacillus sp. 1780r2a1]
MCKVSVIVPFYNCAYIDQALDSLLKQTYSNVEIIVVNDGATEHSDRISPYLHRIIYIEKENGGTASALNVGLRRASGEYICWLSSDDVYPANKIEDQLTFMLKENASFSYTDYHLINKKGAITSRSIGVFYESRLRMLKEMSKGNFINGCTVMIKKEVFDRVGTFNETLLYTHDYDMWLRIIKQVPIHYIDNPLLYYRVHEKMGTMRYGRTIRKEVKRVISSHKSTMQQAIAKEQ